MNPMVIGAVIIAVVFLIFVVRNTIESQTLLQQSIAAQLLIFLSDDTGKVDWNSFRLGASSTFEMANIGNEKQVKRKMMLALSMIRSGLNRYQYERARSLFIGMDWRLFLKSDLSSI